ncbi:hypothetical protein QIS74_03563 [Colletotrichum tabaci]|uniref:Protein kinase domain-containing protein n=1 Tax=Colletotrichum tabaci TaxID=1209068 RepID=A0AAV9TKL5_9PEZI
MPIEIDVLRKLITAPPDCPSFHDEFYRNQFAWCPIRFEMDMGTSHGHNVHNIICPFVRKEKIKPYRDGKRTQVNKATLYAIDVPEELVGSKLQKRMAPAIFEHQEDNTDSSGNRGKMYRFALKQFDSSKHKHFISEKQMFINLENKEGLIQYIGWFRSYESDDQGRLKLYWNIVLELADFDFYTAIRRESPPISGKEILGFWRTMAEISGALASIHTVVVDQQQYLTWHGDIKPENILWANGRFKLADPGEARMLLKSAGASEDQTIELIGGTRTYAAPEKVGYLDGLSQRKPEIPQTSDVWSLGCIFSIAATYVVLGTQGVLIFNRLRREAILNITEHSSDAFHDGRSVLLEVRHWHKYLREAVRKNDAYTHAVLDMVDGYMLVEKDRWSAERICQEFDKLFTSTRLQESEVPASLNSLLQRIEVNSEQLYDQHSGIKEASSDEVARQMTQKTSKSPANVYIVDNGTAMLPYYGKATHNLGVLVWRSLGYDDNGLELYFTNPDTNPRATVAESRSQQVRLFLKAMKYAQPEEPKSPAQAVNTTVVPELARIINRYTRAKASKRPPRKKTIIILTDGIWKGMKMERTIDIYLRSVMYELKDLHGDLPTRQPGQLQEQVDISTIRPVTIQFVQFGEDANAVERLRRLDDDMKLYGCPDLIDTEHADGDVYKMFLGSLCQDIDKQAGYMAGPAISTPPSIERDSFRRQDTLYLPSQREHSSAAVSQTLTRASDQHDRISGDQDQASPSAVQHHELPASPDRRGHTIGSANPVSPSTVASPDGVGFMRESPSYHDTQRSPPTSLASSAPPETPSRSSRRP